MLSEIKQNVEIQLKRKIPLLEFNYPGKFLEH